jgi:hypothetical protein
VKTTRLPTKGPVILPRAIREGHPSDVGTELVVEETPGDVLRYLRSATRFEDVAGCLRYGGCAKTINGDGRRDLERTEATACSRQILTSLCGCLRPMISCSTEWVRRKLYHFAAGQLFAVFASLIGLFHVQLGRRTGSGQRVGNGPQRVWTLPIDENL